MCETSLIIKDIIYSIYLKKKKNFDSEKYEGDTGANLLTRNEKHYMF